MLIRLFHPTSPDCPLRNLWGSIALEEKFQPEKDRGRSNLMALILSLNLNGVTTKNSQYVRGGRPSEGDVVRSIPSSEMLRGR